MKLSHRTCSPVKAAPFVAVLAVVAALATSFWTLRAAEPAENASSNPANEPSVLAVGKAMPAVVNVNTEGVIRRTYRDPAEEFFNQFFGGGVAPRRELRQKVQSLGSGFIVDPSGYIVTNQHVVERANELQIHVTTPDGKTYTARYITGDPAADLALLKIESKTPLPYLSLSDLSPSLLGQTVLVVGNPLGYGHSVARGILSATNRTLTVQEAEYKNLLQTDAAINPGNSGGPLIDLSGKLIGVASAKMAFTPQGVPTQGIGFAIPASTVAAKVEEFKKKAKNQKLPAGGEGGIDLASAARRMLGVSLQELTPDLSEALGVPDGSGVLIADVEPGSPGEKGGLKRGLVLYRVGRFEVNSPEEVESLLRRAGSGSQVDFGVGVIRRIGARVVQQIETVSLSAR
jgi:serine protease Do